MKFLKFAAIFLFGLLMSTAYTSACCTAWRLGDELVRIADQEVLVVWDAEKRVEHFVRRANFESAKIPKDFGFLVPTPTQPKLTEVPDEVFYDLGEIIKPEVQVQKRTKFSMMPYVLAPLFVTAGSSGGTLKADSTVEVLDRAIVGGFEAAVLKASDPRDLLGWLEKNGYGVRPELRDWLAPYLEKQWIVTAFKYANDPDQASLTRASVCLSFETNAPFFPYRVPTDIRVQPQDGSLLRLYFAGTERVVGEFEAGQNRSWKATTKFSNRDERVAKIIKQVTDLSQDEFSFPDSLWLTAFEDETWPGGAEDLYFKPSPEKDPITVPAIVRSEVRTIWMPLDLVLLLIAVGLYLYRKRAKSRE